MDVFITRAGVQGRISVLVVTHPRRIARGPLAFDGLSVAADQSFGLLGVLAE
jgi:hypothetical protein